jgi:tetratricopeptide (TPR) repeat protein
MRRDLFVCLLLVTATVAVFWQVKNHDFIDLDDDMYVSANGYVRGGLSRESIRWAFTTSYGANWHPLTWLSHMADGQLFGLDAGRHHLTSALLHTANALLLFLVLFQMTQALWRSALVAALFALHPLHLESVAWIAERKDVLSTFFWMLTLGSYLAYVKRPWPLLYLLTLLTFACGLMAKPMLVTLPCVLLLLDYWPLGRLEVSRSSAAPDGYYQQQTTGAGRRSTVVSLLVEKIPFFLLSGASSVITFLAQRQGGAIKSMELFSFESRIANALVSYVRYVGKMIWPEHLAIYYPHPGDALPLWQPVAAALVIATITVFALRAARRHPYLVVGWFWYFGTLVPVIGLVQIGGQAMADRYTYVPLIGLFLMIAWGGAELAARSSFLRKPLAVLAVLMVTALGLRSWWQLQFWRDSITLFEHTLQVTSGNSLIHNNLGIALARQGRVEEAIAHYREALTINPMNVNASINLGVALMGLGRLEEAVDQYGKLLELQPHHPGVHNNLGNALVLQGKLDEAAVEFKRALEIKPDYFEAYNNLGVVLAQQGRLPEAASCFMEALRINPSYAQAQKNLELLSQQGGEMNTPPQSASKP